MIFFRQDVLAQLALLLRSYLTMFSRFDDVTSAQTDG